MTSRYLENRIEDLRRVCTALAGESKDPDAKGEPFAAEVEIACGHIARAMDLLRVCVDKQVDAEIVRYKGE